MATALSNSTHTDENLETYSLIWLDSNVNNASENRQTQQHLKATIHHFLTFEDDQQFLRYVKNLSKNDRIILITSGRFGREVVPTIVALRQITAIYIYCMDKRANEHLAQKFSKVKSVVVRLDELIQQIQRDYLQQQDTKVDESLVIKVFDGKSSSSEEFVQFQVLIDCLIRMKSFSSDKTELVSFCKQYYHKNQTQMTMIREFETSYTSDRALWWYTRYAFLSRLLNKALRDENIHLLYQLRFILHDLGCQLGKYRSTAPVCVYRSQIMSKEEIQIFNNSMGKVISINSFLSTTVDLEKCRTTLLQLTDFSNDTERVLFEIRADPQLRNSRPFSNIQSLSYSSTLKQVLFMVGSIFRISQVQRDNDRIWNIRLVLCSVSDQQLKPLAERMRNDLGTGRTNLMRFSSILRQMGKFDHCEKYYRRALNQLPGKHPDILHCYQALGMIAESKKNFPSSLKWYKKSLQIQGSDDSASADMYNNIGDIYSKITDYPNAIKSYKKALEIWNKTSGDPHPRLVKCLNNLGAVYDMMKNYSESMQCYEQALEISKKNKDPEHALTLRNIANVYELQGNFKQAAKYYEKALKIYRGSSSPNTTFINDIQASIRRVSSKKE